MDKQEGFIAALFASCGCFFATLIILIEIAIPIAVLVLLYKLIIHFT